MNENVKTLTFLAVAAAAVLLAVFTRPSLPEASTENYHGQELFPNFTDPLAVTGLEIVEFNEDTATVRKFMVAEVEEDGKTRWVIPSHDNYPADAKDQVVDAAGSLIGPRIIDLAGDRHGDRRTYGVAAPDPLVLKVGDTGVGRQVVMRDENGKELLALVIGNEVPDRPGQRYVRKVGEDQIFVVQLSTDKLSTKFEDWIDRNLLGMESWDIRRLRFRDYSVDELNGALIQRGDVRVAYDDAGDPRWKLIEYLKFEGGKWAPVELAENEKLNVAKLDEMKTALDDLKIVDVSRKPEGISADLKAEAGFKADQKTFMQLLSKGFVLYRPEKNAPLELFSNEGELRITMKNGVEYVLRFGEIAGAGTAEEEDKPKQGDEQGEDEEKTPTGVNRYLLVMAEFNPDIIPEPKLEPLPEIKKNTEKKTAEEKTTEEKKPDRDKSPAEADEENRPDGGSEGKETADEKTAEQIKAERERIEKENQRKKDEYQRRIAEGKKRVTELNDRFADWYYIISDKVYRKIHLTGDELIVIKEKPAEDQQGEKDGTGEPNQPALPAEVLEDLKAQGPAEDE